MSVTFSFLNTNFDRKITQQGATNPQQPVVKSFAAPQDTFVRQNSAAKLAFGYSEKDYVNIKPGCHYNKEKRTLDFGLMSANAGHVELWIYKEPHGKKTNTKDSYQEAARIPLEKIGKKWVVSVPKEELKKDGIDIDNQPLYYGYRVWGKEASNWEYKKGWKPSSANGFNEHVDEKGNRFNPNKLLTDPEATEVSHDPVTVGINDSMVVYASGSDAYKIDTAPFAPKSIFVMPKSDEPSVDVPKIRRPLTSDNIYEAHVKGLTAGHTKETLLKLYDVLKEENQKDPEKIKEIDKIQKRIKLPASKGGWDDKYAGTYKGAAFMAPYLKLIGITAVEFLPVQEFQNSEKDHFGKNYWGYMTLSYKAPERNYASDKTPGGPTKEFKEMVNEFHRNDVKVIMDVVYNHTGEGNAYGGHPEKANILNLRGIDNTSYYETAQDPKYYYDSNGCGANLNTANPIAQQLTLNTLKYWKDDMGVDGFRFDLASVLGNTRANEHGFWFDAYHKDSLLQKIENLGVRSKKGGTGVDLIAEPWGYGDGTYQVGNFTNNYSEWNGPARDILRRSINKFGKDNVRPLDLIRFFSGSYDTFKNKNPRTVNFIDCHDGYTMHDMFAYNTKRTTEQGSEGGTDDAGNHSWDQGGNIEMRKQAVRTAQSLLALSVGTPMILAGDERLNTTLGNNNPWNIDGPLNYINWGNPKHEREIDALRKAGNLKFPEIRAKRDADNTYKMTEQEQNDMTKFTSRLFNFRINHPSIRPYKYYDGKDHNGVNGKDIEWLDKDANEVIGSTEKGRDYMNNPDNHLVAFRLDGTEFKDAETKKGESASSIYIAYNKGGIHEKVKLPEHMLPNKDWYMVADTSSHPNSVLGEDNIKRDGEEVKVSEKALELNPRSTVILIEKEKKQA